MTPFQPKDPVWVTESGTKVPGVVNGCHGGKCMVDICGTNQALLVDEAYLKHRGCVEKIRGLERVRQALAQVNQEDPDPVLPRGRNDRESAAEPVRRLLRGAPALQLQGVGRSGVHAGDPHGLLVMDFVRDESMSREPNMTLAELSRAKGVPVRALAGMAAYLPLPEAAPTKGVQMGMRVSRRKTAYYARSELLAWFDKAYPEGA